MPIKTDLDNLFAVVMGGIQNDNVAADAAIVDTKLATIATASKVNGSSLVAASVATAALATNAVTQISMASGTTDISREGTYTTMTDMSVTLTLVTGTVLILFSAYCYTDTTLGHFRFKDSVTSNTYNFARLESDSYGNVCGALVITGLSAAAHTFTVEWAETTGAGGEAVHNDAATHGIDRRLIVLELKK